MTMPGAYLIFHDSSFLSGEGYFQLAGGGKDMVRPLHTSAHRCLPYGRRNAWRCWHRCWLDLPDLVN